ncbi:MAG: anhydro-N-acetylmuramic acid kinase [Hyphomonas sp.]|uniref:anhydro-N-acetylmuramic acid kinase n=1 Tax=Hyphomonas sp. TaxID=87 RepID=UPI003528EB8E
MNTAISDSEPKWAAGFMSGTSLDAVDAALILTDGIDVLEFGPVAERKYTAEERKILQVATDAARAWNWTGPPPEDAFEEARKVITWTHASAWGQLLSGWLGPDPALVGVHGQTVLHRRPVPGCPGATLQLIDAAAMREVLEVPLAYDFRSADVAAGGQGAPLAPAYHAALLEHLGEGAACMLNLGGVANITAKLSDGTLFAFDTGPANGPIDEWVERHGHGTHDAGGGLALAGKADEDLLARLLQRDWFREPAPKSLDRYDFTAAMVEGMSLEDGAATLTEFSARAVAMGVALLPEVPSQVIACGGGRHNPALMDALARALPCPVYSAEGAGLRGDSIEAEAFAFLAARTARGLPISWPGTTGVPEPMTGGVLLA